MSCDGDGRGVSDREICVGIAPGGTEGGSLALEGGAEA